MMLSVFTNRKLMAILPALAISLAAQTTLSNIGPTPPPQVNADLSVTYFLNFNNWITSAKGRFSSA
jgi:hypothetical protein